MYWLDNDVSFAEVVQPQKRR